MIGTIPPSRTKQQSVRRDLRISTVEGTLYCVMVGIGETYFIPFGLAVGLSESTAGLLGTVPLLIGSVLQLAAPVGIRLVGSMRRWMVIGSAVQGLSFIPLVIGAFSGSIPTWMLFLFVSLYHTTNLAQGPAWNVWITTLVPRRVRATYFGRRSQILQGGVLLGIAIGGFTLAARQDADQAAITFGALFLAACVVRLICARLLAIHSEPVPLPERYRHVGPREVLARLRTGADVRLLAYLLLVALAQQIALPFFAPYVLEQRSLDYDQFTILVAAAIVGRMLTSMQLGRLARRLGPRPLIWFGAAATAPVSALWLAADSFSTLVIVQIIHGIGAGAFDIGSMLLRFETIPEHERSSLSATFNALNGFVTFAGSLIGFWLFQVFGETTTGYAWVFFLAFGARLILVPLFTLVPAAVPDPYPLPIRPVGVDPATGERVRPMLEDEAD